MKQQTVLVMALTVLMSVGLVCLQSSSAVAQTVLEDSFEGGTGSWTVRSGKAMPSLDLQRARSGRIAIRAGRDEVMEQRFSGPMVGSIEVWLYDNGDLNAFDDTRQVLAGEMGSNFFMLGISTNVSPTHYIYRAGGVGTERATNVPRSVGWRHLKMEFTGKMVIYYIDGREVATSSVDGRLQAVGIGNYWNNAAGVGWYDDVRINVSPAPAYAFTLGGALRTNLAHENGEFLENRGLDLRRSTSLDVDVTYKSEALEVFVPLRSTTLGERINLGLNRRDVWHMRGQMGSWTINAAGARVDNSWGYTGGDDPFGLTHRDGINRTNATTINVRGMTGQVSHIFYLGDRHDSFRFGWWRPKVTTETGWTLGGLVLRRWNPTDFADGIGNLSFDISGRLGSVDVAGAVARSQTETETGSALRLSLGNNLFGWRWNTVFMRADPTFEAPISNGDHSPVRKVIGKGHLQVTGTREARLGDQVFGLKVSESYWMDSEGYLTENVLGAEVTTRIFQRMETKLTAELQELPRESNVTTALEYSVPVSSTLTYSGDVEWTRQTETFLVDDTFDRHSTTQGIKWAPGGGLFVDVDYTWKSGNQWKDGAASEISGARTIVYGRYQATAAPGRFRLLDVLGGTLAVWTRTQDPTDVTERTAVVYGELNIGKGPVSLRTAAITSDVGTSDTWTPHPEVVPTLSVTGALLTQGLGTIELEAKRRFDLEETNLMLRVKRRVGAGNLTIGVGETGFQSVNLSSNHEFKGMPWEFLLKQGQSRNKTRDHYYTLEYVIPF